MAWDTRAWHSSALPTSAATKIASPPWACASAVVSRPASAEMSDSTRHAPSRTAMSAIARPMPEAAPVTSTTFFFSMGSLQSARQRAAARVTNSHHRATPDRSSPRGWGELTGPADVRLCADKHTRAARQTAPWRGLRENGRKARI